MADRTFSNKKKRKARSSLGLRISSICFALIVIPLIVHAIFTYGREYREGMQYLISMLKIMTLGEERSLSLTIKSELHDLNTLGTAISNRDKSSLSPLFARITAQEDLVSLFYLSIDSNVSSVCVSSSEPKMVGEKNLFPEQVHELLTGAPVAFLAIDPIAKKKVVYVSQPIYSAKSEWPIGALFRGISAEMLLNRINIDVMSQITFNVSLITPKQTLFTSLDDQFTLNSVKILTPEDYALTMQDNFFWEGKPFSIRTPNIGFQVAVEGTQFSLLTDIPSSVISQIARKKVVSHISSFFLIFIILGGTGALILIWLMGKPLQKLSSVMEQVGEGNLNARFQSQSMGFEVNNLGMYFNDMLDQLKHHMKKSNEEQIAKELLQNELRIGFDIQKAFLPKVLPEFPGVTISSGFQAAKEVAGDFYDLFVKQDENGKKLLIAMGDASGKGVSACLYSINVRMSLRAAMLAQETVNEVVCETNDLLCLDTKDSGNFITAWVGIYDERFRTLSYTSCGHLPTILRKKDGTIQELNTKGMALGVSQFEDIEVKNIKLEAGDLLVCFTDGIIEAQNDQKQFFGKERFINAIDQMASANTDQVVNDLLEEVNLFIQDSEPFDDLSIIAIRVE